MKIVFFTCIIVLWMGCVQPNDIKKELNVQDSIKANSFFVGKDICDFSLGKGFAEIHPTVISWATDPTDPYSEGYIIDGKYLKIIQPLKRSDIHDSLRLYSFNNKPLKVIRVINDTLMFDFNKIVVDYSDIPNTFFRNQSTLLLINEPVDWTGLANQFRFIQFIDLTKMTCYEFFVDYYSCATN